MKKLLLILAMLSASSVWGAATPTPGPVTGWSSTGNQVYVTGGTVALGGGYIGASITADASTSSSTRNNLLSSLTGSAAVLPSLLAIPQSLSVTNRTASSSDTALPLTWLAGSISYAAYGVEVTNRNVDPLLFVVTTSSSAPPIQAYNVLDVSRTAQPDWLTGTAGSGVWLHYMRGASADMDFGFKLLVK